MKDSIESYEQLDLRKRYSYADYLLWKLEDYVELIRGKVFRMSPAPSSYHQQISSNLLVELSRNRDQYGCRIFHAPFDVRLFPIKDDSNNDTVVQPDLCVVCDQSKLDEKGCLGAPELIVEILSQSTSKKDLRDKFDLYQEAGVMEYWIVNPWNKAIEIFELSEGKYQLKGIYLEGDTIQVTLLSGMEIPVQEVFR